MLAETVNPALPFGGAAETNDFPRSCPTKLIVRVPVVSRLYTTHQQHHCRLPMKSSIWRLQ